MIQQVNTVAPGPVYTGGASPERIEKLGRATICVDRTGHRCLFRHIV